MRILVTGGGTGGHVFPALEVARLAQAQGHEVTYFGSQRGQEAERAPQAGIEFEGFPVAPFRASQLSSWVNTLRAIRAVRQRLLKQRFDGVLSTGGYPAGPVLLALRSFEVPVVFLEANAVPGRVHRLRLKHLRKVCVVFEEAKQYYSVPCERTGLPLRGELVEIARSFPSSGNGGYTTVCLGGSQGAETLNRVFLGLVKTHIEDESLRWVQVCGKNLYQQCQETASLYGLSARLRIEPFLKGEELAGLYSMVQEAISRAGAGTLSELALFGIPSVLVPYPYASFAHQARNAEVFQRLGGAVVIEQNSLTPESLERAWRWWYESKERREEASRSLRAWSVPDATQRVLKALVDEIDAFQKRSR